MMKNKIENPFDYETLSNLPLTVELCGGIVAAIQTAIYQEKTINSFAPLREPKRFVKANGQYIVTEIRYGQTFMNSYLDITYPSADMAVRYPVVFYTHGGGFFGGSKTLGDPLAVGDAHNFMFEDIVGTGFTFVNVDYVLTPAGYFPDPLRQLAEAIDYCAEHAEALNLDMSRIAVMGSSAGAILTAQYGALLVNPIYRERLQIQPKIDPASVRCLVIDDAPLRTECFNWKMRSMMGNYLKTTDMSSDTALSYNAYAFFNADMKPCFFDAGPLDGFPEDMLACGEKLDALGVENEVFIPEEKLPHGFLNLARENDEAARCEKRILAFLKKYINAAADPEALK